MCLGQFKDGKAQRQIFLSPDNQLRAAEQPLFECGIEQPLCLYGFADIEYARHLSDHRRVLVEPGDVALRVVLQVKLVAACQGSHLNNQLHAALSRTWSSLAR